ncbi:MAG: hypothetical protein KF826_03180 [Xanthobacteraceae bacterium]|nr:hypothetical protein [Xanthobacteraceae bacterium]MCW5679338.1 hypothetical protein [Xanthobacteraceae bacterium]
MADELWQIATSIKSLKAGWHLTRAETRSDFVQDYLLVDSFAYNLDGHVKELRRQLVTNTYEPRPPIRIDVPKAAFGIRPGSLISLHDRVVLYSIIRTIGSTFDGKLSDCVYSYRLKDKPTREALFKESDVLDIPFLKGATIREKVDPFEPWYGLWPEFDAKSREILESGYRYLSVSDIAAYFENISLPILRDQLLRILPEEHKIVNTICQCLEAWAVKTEDGFRPHRGIPQGSNIPSFFGNFFLRPIDQHFETAFGKDEIKYYRYMDDIRIFSKELTVARRCLFDLERQIRKLHLNVQSAKTRILDEKMGEISDSLIDHRIDRIRDLREQDDFLEDRKSSIAKLKQIGVLEPNRRSGVKLTDPRRKKDDLSLRAFRMWCNSLLGLRSPHYLNHLKREAKINSDHRITRIFIQSCRTFPRHANLSNFITEYISSDFNIFPYQEAEFIHALRYMSRLPASAHTNAVVNILDQKKYFYVRMQSCLLAGRLMLAEKELQAIMELLDTETDEHVLSHLAVPLAQLDGTDGEKVVRFYLHHQNPRLSMIGQHIVGIRDVDDYSKKFLSHAIDKKALMRVCDYVGILWYVTKSDNPRILQNMIELLDEVGPQHPVVELRDLLGSMNTTASAQREAYEGN